MDTGSGCNHHFERNGNFCVILQSHTETATVLRLNFRLNRGRSHWPYGRCSHFSRREEFWTVPNSLRRPFDLSSAFACTARTVVAVIALLLYSVCRDVTKRKYIRIRWMWILALQTLFVE